MQSQHSCVPGRGDGSGLGQPRDQRTRWRVILGCKKEHWAHHPLLAWCFPARRLPHNDLICSHSNSMEGGFFCLHNLKHNIYEKNNPSPSSLLLKSLLSQRNLRSQCKLFPQRAYRCFNAFLRTAGRWEMCHLEPGQVNVEVSLTQLQGKHQLPPEQGLRKPLHNSPSHSITSGWRLAQGCASSLPFFELSTRFIRFISFSLHEFPPHSGRSPSTCLGGAKAELKVCTHTAMHVQLSSYSCARTAVHTHTLRAHSN